jgi:hypothetical protein
MPPLYTAKACFKALSATCKRFSIEDYVLAITTDSHVVNDGMCTQFEKLALKSADTGFQSPNPPPIVFKAANAHIQCMAHALNLLAQAILAELKSGASKDTSHLYDDTRFTNKATYALAVGKARRIIVRY